RGLGRGGGRGRGRGGGGGRRGGRGVGGGRGHGEARACRSQRPIYRAWTRKFGLLGGGVLGAPGVSRRLGMARRSRRSPRRSANDARAA
ncbi:MAG: hypothetical protein EVA89_24075, partial [Sandaracinaceae bacterium]